MKLWGRGNYYPSNNSWNEKTRPCSIHLDKTLSNFQGTSVYLCTVKMGQLIRYHPVICHLFVNYNKTIFLCSKYKLSSKLQKQF